MALAVAAPLFAQSDPLTDLLKGDEDKAELESARVIKADASAVDDEKIRLRLSNIFSELNDLDQVSVEVSNSVVTLSGETETIKAVSRAGALAKQVDGVVDVENHVTVITDVGRRVDTTLNQLKANLKGLVAALPMLAIALAIVLAAWFLGRWLAHRPGFFRRIAPNLFIADLLSKLGWLAVTMVGVILALSLLDATSIIGTVLGAAGIVGLAVGFAVKDTVENYISSILLSLRNPFLIRDYVAIGDIEGSVARLTSRATVLISADGNHIRIPNSTVFKAVIVNYTRNPQRRFKFSVGVGNDVALAAAQQLALETIKKVPGVLDTPAGVALIDELGDSSVLLLVHAWIDQRSHDILKVKSEAIRQVKQAFDDAGIAMPEPTYRLVMNSELVDEGCGSPAVSQAQVPAGKQDLDPSEDDIDTVVQDTIADTSVEAPLNEEIHNSDDENLLSGSAPHE